MLPFFFIINPFVVSPNSNIIGIGANERNLIGPSSFIPANISKLFDILFRPPWYPFIDASVIVSNNIFDVPDISYIFISLPLDWAVKRYLPSGDIPTRLWPFNSELVKLLFTSLLQSVIEFPLT